MSVAESLLSKVIDANEISVLDRFAVEREHFATDGERKAYDFIRKYAAENGNTPSYATVATECADFTYIPQVSDEYSYLVRKLKDTAGKRSLLRLFNEVVDERTGVRKESEVSRRFSELDTEAFISWFTDELESVNIRIRTKTRTSGKTLEELRHSFREEYEKRKSGQSFKLWNTPFESLNAEIGGLYSGDIYGVMAESGRGKSYLIIVLVDELLRQGAKVLVKSYELKSYLWLSRLFSVLTAREGAFNHADHTEKVGLPNKAILSGRLDGEIETYFLEMVDAINRYYPGELYLQAKGDADLPRTLADLDRELKNNTEIDVVVIDPFYGLDDVYGSNANRTAGGAAEQAARKFERIIGENDVVGIYAVQASTERQNTEEDGHREIKLPKRDQVKTTKALLEIATNLFAFDAVDGSGRIGVDKGRNGGEGFTVELTALMDYGVLRELPKGEAVAKQFTEQF